MTQLSGIEIMRLASTDHNLRNVYFVYLKPDEEQKEGKVAIREHYSEWEPPESVWLGDLFVAESPGKARVAFLKHFSDEAWIEDWKNIRVRKVGETTLGFGTKEMFKHPDFDQFWKKIHEIIDHDGKDCDCPFEEE